MVSLENLLSGGDLRSIGKSNLIATQIRNQKEFDELFDFMFHQNKIVVMRAADAIEKLTILNSNYLKKHKMKIFDLSAIAEDKELKWHLALLIPRLILNARELNKAWNILLTWAMAKTNSKMVRVNSLQGLFELTKRNGVFMKSFLQTVHELNKENIPSINARIRTLTGTLASTK